MVRRSSSVAANTGGNLLLPYLLNNISFKIEKQFRFDEDTKRVELDYPRNISKWQGVGTDIDAVFQWKDGKLLAPPN